MFGDDWSNSKEMATVFRNPRWRRRHLELLQLFFYDVIDMFQLEVPIFPLMLVAIDQLVKTWQQFFEIQDVGGHHLEL